MLTLLCAAVPAAGQEWRVTVAVGPAGFASLMEPGHVIERPDGDRLATGRLGPFVGFAGSVGVTRSDSRWGLRVGGFATIPDRQATTYICRAAYCYGLELRAEIPVRVVAATADVLFFPVRTAPARQGYFVLGAGGRWYVFEPGRTPSFTFPAESGRRGGVAILLGSGLAFSWPFVGLSVEIGDYMGMLEDPGAGMTHDLVLRLSLVPSPRGR